VEEHPYGRPLPRPRRVGPRGRTVELPPNGWTVEEVERRLAWELDEWLYVFDPKGQQIARFRGTEEAVDFSDELKRNIGGLYGASVLRDHTFVHNHPVRGDVERVTTHPPSPSDLLAAVERDLQQMIVVSGNARHVLRRPGDAWPADEHLMHEIVGLLAQEFDQSVGSGGGDLGGGVRRLEFILTRLNAEGWIDYERTIPAWNAG
jgi:hypothetical protein